MPPKNTPSSQPSTQTSQPKKCSLKQTTLFGKLLQPSLPPPPSNKGKQFKQGSSTLGKSSAHRWKLGTGILPSNLFIASWNVNGIRSVLQKGDLHKYIQQVKPDILCINETKIDEKAFDQKPIEIEGYQGYWNFCKVSAGYSGVAVFSKVEPISVVEDLTEVGNSQEGRVLTLEYERFYLVACYVPNAGTDLVRLDYRVNNYDADFQNHLESLRSKKPVILSGDLNVVHQQIDIARPKGNQRCPGFTIQQRNSFSKFLSKGWVDTFRYLYPEKAKYSWWSMRTGGRKMNVGWRLDYFVVPEEFVEFVKDSRINNDVYGSDHCPIELVVGL